MGTSWQNDVAHASKPGVSGQVLLQRERAEACRSYLLGSQGVVLFFNSLRECVEAVPAHLIFQVFHRPHDCPHRGRRRGFLALGPEACKEILADLQLQSIAKCKNAVPQQQQQQWPRQAGPAAPRGKPQFQLARPLDMSTTSSVQHALEFDLHLEGSGDAGHWRGSSLCHAQRLAHCPDAKLQLHTRVSPFRTSTAEACLAGAVGGRRQAPATATQGCAGK